MGKIFEFKSQLLINQRVVGSIPTRRNFVFYLQINLGSY